MEVCYNANIAEVKIMNIIETNPDSHDAILMIEELSRELEAITGSSGKNSFDTKDVCVSGSMFVIAYDEEEKPIGCGAIRPINEKVAEVKRMYAKNKSMNVGTEVLKYLEIQAQKIGYSTLWLETRVINERAVIFYEKRGYHRIPNYGKYVDKPEAVCFEKLLK
jgi:GNAT superfamily N-acetyltransferase